MQKLEVAQHRISPCYTSAVTSKYSYLFTSYFIFSQHKHFFGVKALAASTSTRAVTLYPSSDSLGSSSKPACTTGVNVSSKYLFSRGATIIEETQNQPPHPKNRNVKYTKKVIAAGVRRAKDEKAPGYYHHNEDPQCEQGNTRALRSGSLSLYSVYTNRRIL